MGYGLAVFEPKQELRDRRTFLDWWEMRTSWKDGLDYNNPSNATPKLRAWFDAMLPTFPPLNGPMRTTNVLEGGTGWEADYTIARELIYVEFPSGKGGVAYETCKHLAAQFSVGFFEASESPSAAFFPSEDGTLEKVHEGREVPQWVEKLREEQEKNSVIYVDSIGEVFEKMTELRHLGSAAPAVRLRPETELFRSIKSEPGQGTDE
jgi:hypothetical protein